MLTQHPFSYRCFLNQHHLSVKVHKGHSSIQQFANMLSLMSLYTVNPVIHKKLFAVVLDSKKAKQSFTTVKALQFVTMQQYLKRKQPTLTRNISGLLLLNTSYKPSGGKQSDGNKQLSGCLGGVPDAINTRLHLCLPLEWLWSAIWT